MEDMRNMIRQMAKELRDNNLNVDLEILADTLFYRLTIIRLGEEDNNAWWESSILGEVGRRNLESFFPNTFHRQRYDIARKIVTEKENREIPEKLFITLFNYGYDFETEVFKPFVKDMSKSSDWPQVLEMIEGIKNKRFTSPWAREFYKISKLPTNILEESNTKELGSISKDFYNNKDSFDDAIKLFISVYDLCMPGNVVTPYYKRRMAI